MKRFTFIPILMSIFAALAIAKSYTSNAVFIQAKNLKWVALADFPGVAIATVEGDRKNGPYHAFIKFEGGFATPMYHHTADHFATVVAGDLTITTDGEDHHLTPGSFFSFKKKQVHSTTCAPGAECIIFADVRGKWDVITQKKLVLNR
ncbi:hypothetical protein CIK05_06130 [Bdellovibrio sp. qaytius]|nr:hypothetical protein CIK05_06130 [Bdellovibrio sp. qaytius]